LVSLNRDDSVRDGHMPGRLGAFNRRSIHRSLEDATREPRCGLATAAVVSGLWFRSCLFSASSELGRDRFRSLGIAESRQFVYEQRRTVSVFIQPTSLRAQKPRFSELALTRSRLRQLGNSLFHRIRFDTWQPLVSWLKRLVHPDL